MTGTTLFPLNQLKTAHPKIYAEHVKKYAGREHLLETKIPILDCLWNDVIHFTAVPPQELFANLEKAGINAGEIIWKKWYRIPIDILDHTKTVTCLYRRDVSPIPDARDFNPFDPSKMHEYRKVPDETIQYYCEQRAKGERPLFFHRVPHILYKGTVDINSCEIVEL